MSKLEHVENTSFCVGDMRNMALFADSSFDIVHGRDIYADAFRATWTLTTLALEKR